jgi:hypothetical protein
VNDESIGRVGRHLRSWFTGRPVPGEPIRDYCATVVLEDAGHCAALAEAGVLGPDSVVLVPEGQLPTDEAPAVNAVGYTGSFGEPGSDIAVAQTIFVQTQDYSTSPYMTLMGTTLVRITGTVDFEAFLADADLAREEGRMADFVVSPAVQIADVPSIGAGAAGDGPRMRLYVGPDGELSTAPGGLRLGTVGDPVESLDAQWRRINADSAHPCAVGLGAVLDEQVRCAALDERPWLGRYLDALDLHRDLAGRGITEVRVSGFGGRLVPDLAALADDRDCDGTGGPLLAWTPDVCYLRAPGSGRLFTLGRQAAEIAEALLVCGSVDAAAGYVDRAALERVSVVLQRNGIALATPVAGAGV